MDYELEMGIFIGVGNEAGSADPDHEAEQHVFGFCLLNDWSARDIQSWEYQPLGPVLVEELRDHALAVDRHCRGARTVSRPVASGPPADPQPLPYLD